MRLATVAEMRRIEARAAAEFDLSPEILMESAGSLAAREVARLRKRRVVVICGAGNNGADGFVCARHLRASGVHAKVLAVGERSSRADAEDMWTRQRERYRLAGGEFTDVAALREFDVVVDALFGIGFSGEARTAERTVIEAVNVWRRENFRSLEARARVVSLDLPSGLDAQTGLARPAVRADLTISFSPPQPGLFLNDGPAHAGRVLRRAIGFPPALVGEVAQQLKLFTEREARKSLPTRPDHSNKSSHGRLLVLAGKPGLWGAGVLASHAAFRVGAGYVTWASTEAPVAALSQVAEALTAKVDDALLERHRWTAVAIGPGFGHGKDVAQIIERLRAEGGPVVIDADAITACVEHDLFPLPSNWVMTPHAGELGRVLDMSAKEIEDDRLAAVSKATQKTGAHVLLKGFRTVVGHGERAVLIDAGNAALAKAGSGDVLTGTIGGLLAQGLGPLKAACLGAYLHGRMADDWLAAGNDKISLSAGDLHDLLPPLIARLRNPS